MLLSLSCEYVIISHLFCGLTLSGLIKESLNADIEQFDKHTNSGKSVLKCVKDKNREGKIIKTFDRKIG
jgi:hypothetical protein